MEKKESQMEERKRAATKSLGQERDSESSPSLQHTGG
jgi:hypothetical protein